MPSYRLQRLTMDEYGRRVYNPEVCTHHLASVLRLEGAHSFVVRPRALPLLPRLRRAASALLFITRRQLQVRLAFPAH